MLVLIILLLQARKLTLRLIVTDQQRALSKLHNSILSYSKFLVQELLLIRVDLYPVMEPVNLSGSLKPRALTFKRDAQIRQFSCQGDLVKTDRVLCIVC